MKTVEFIRCEKCQKIWAVGNPNHKCKTDEVLRNTSRKPLTDTAKE